MCEYVTSEKERDFVENAVKVGDVERGMVESLGLLVEGLSLFGVSVEEAAAVFKVFAENLPDIPAKREAWWRKWIDSVKRLKWW